MGITTEWQSSEMNVILFTVEGSWTWEDFHSEMRTAYEMLDTTPYEYVDYIVDMQHGETLPSNILSRMKSVSESNHSKSRYMVVVAAGRFPEMMFNIMAKILPNRMEHIKLVSTMDEAKKYLASKTLSAG